MSLDVNFITAFCENLFSQSHAFSGSVSYEMASSSKDVFVPGDDDELLAQLINTVSDDDDSLSLSEIEDSSTGKACLTNSSSDSENNVVFQPHSVRRNVIESEDANAENVGMNEDDSSDHPTQYEEVKSGHDRPPSHSFSFMENTGPRHAPPPEAPPISYFNLFFTISLLNLLVQETNRNAEQYLETHRNELPHSRTRMWKKVTVTEIKAFVAVLLEMGITRRPTIVSYWSTNSRCISWFGKMFSRNRYQLILKFFHLVDNSKIPPPTHENYDPCCRFQPLVEHANRVFRLHYSPHQHLSVDETLVGTKSHTQLLQYLPRKQHHKWGIKFWMLCDSVVNYCLAFYCYRGARSKEDKEEIKKHGLSYVVVNKLLDIGNYLMKGFHVVMDNFFTGIQLASDLYKKSTFMTGTLRRNRTGIPEGLKRKFGIGEIKYFRNKEILLAGYREKKSQKNPVLLLATNAEADEETIIRKRHGRVRETVTPKVVQLYNNFMGGIDSSDMMVYTYLDERKTLKFWKKVIFSIFARMVSNAYIIYKENSSGRKMTRLQFISSIIESIEDEWLAVKDDGKTAGPVSTRSGIAVHTGAIGIRKLPGRLQKVCVVCSRKDGGPVRKSRTICIQCEKGLHGECIVKHRC